MAFVPFTASDQPTMAAFNEKFQNLMTDIVDKGVHIEWVSYIGTGNSGASSPCSLTFSFAPDIVIAAYYINSAGDCIRLFGRDTDNRSCYAVYMDSLSEEYKSYRGFSEGMDTNNTFAKKSEDGKTLSFYVNGGAVYQLNYSGYPYHFIAIASGGVA